MNPADMSLLVALPAWAFAFVMVLARLSAAIMVMPALGEADIPATVRAGIAVALSLLLLPLVAPLVPAVPGDVVHTVGAIAAELLTGLWLGFLARLIVLSLTIAGQYISFMTGLANVLQADAGTGQQVTVVARLFNVAAPALLLASGAYILPLSALYGSFSIIAPGSLVAVGDASASVVDMLEQSVAVALRLAAPFLIGNIVWYVSIGLLARLAPTLHLFLVALPGQVLGGMLLFALLSTALFATWNAAVQVGYGQLPGLH